MRLLTRAMILDALEALARELEATGRREEIVIAGGAALVLIYNAREATRDVDVCWVASDSAAVREAARRVASGLDLPVDWLNDGVKGYLNGLLPGDVLLDRPALLVRVLEPRQLLAMKLSAWRDDVDISDARLLLPGIEGQREDVWHAIEPFLVLGRELKARYAFEDLWESVHEA